MLLLSILCFCAGSISAKCKCPGYNSSFRILFANLYTLSAFRGKCPISVVKSYFVAQPVQTVSSVRDLGLLLNSGFSADEYVALATKKARGMLFYLKRSFAALTPCIFLPLYKAFIRPHLEYAIQASSPILSPGTARR